MAKVRPFKAVRPVKDKVHLVASRSYVSYSPEQLDAKLNENPFTFIHIINPDHGRKNPAAKASVELFRRIGHRFNEFLEDGVFQRDVKAQMYLYRQESNSNVSVGIIAAVSNDDYRDGLIKKHEQTIERREQLFAQYLDTVSFNAEPVLLCHENSEEIDHLMRKVMGSSPEYDFTTTDRARHTLWTISDPSMIKLFEEEYDQIDSLYIADGHHRSASSARLADLRGSGENKEKAFEHFMAYIIPSSSLTIKGFHRMLKDLNGQSSTQFIEALKKVCELQSIYIPGSDLRKGMMDLYIDSKWYRLDASSQIEPYEPDSSWLTDHVLSPILDIKDLRTDKRIKFLPGSNSVESIMKAVDSGEFAAGIYMHPVAFSELKHISDNGGTMPPKSTWIEPKLRSGLTIFTFLEEENLAE